MWSWRANIWTVVAGVVSALGFASILRPVISMEPKVSGRLYHKSMQTYENLWRCA